MLLQIKLVFIIFALTRNFPFSEILKITPGTSDLVAMLRYIVIVQSDETAPTGLVPFDIFPTDPHVLFIVLHLGPAI